MRHALINSQGNVVENVIELLEGADWKRPAGCFLVRSDTANIGDIYQDGEFTVPD